MGKSHKQNTSTKNEFSHILILMVLEMGMSRGVNKLNFPF